MHIRPTDSSLALRTIASFDVAAFRTAVTDEGVRRYMHECRASTQVASTNTRVWARGFARYPQQFVDACAARKAGDLELALPPEVLVGTGPKGAQLWGHVSEHGEAGVSVGVTQVSDALVWNARLSLLPLSVAELDAFSEFALTRSKQDLLQALMTTDPVKVLAERADVDWDSLAPHLIWQQLAPQPVPTDDILRYHRAGMVDPLNLERAHEDELPVEYGRALDA